ncbi:hypothetical protein TVAG_481420 [Trichomonas vaginalis G3]|uniref:Uncharacterized protein n=1 Tax=Trichomonas vaginalis (strain ATCC PRA-98 / G3) TaxID=412133 RepID=A2F217_TRIV3|nr:hypothetical protein TVAGG3_0477210 [Trichomonas vaginalis G3]EAY01072.1 hypothetical protein TVAG_481420 [Trichomonas vaginalis G3]KAI5515491.1 hypothetical protein TVAGG3_0477210 [Trichomonas vaginalis G3]|eukprot:XP_001330093.1 hypothetical protein [Trichomonas vaginalis G3]
MYQFNFILKNARKFSWSEYFGSKNKVTQTQNGAAFSDTSSSSSYYVYLCNFESCTEKGAIYIERSNEICTLLEDSTFNHCKSTLEGGSVYYNCQSAGQIVQKRTGYYASISTNSYMAFIHTVKPADLNKNYFIDSSVSNCGESEGKGSLTLDIDYGDICIQNNNISNNICNEYSSIRSILWGESRNCNFTTFIGNKQSRSQSLRFTVYNDETSLIQTVSYCNVIGNKCGTNSNQVLFSCKYNTNIDHCVFFKNTAKWMFYIEYSDYKLTITDSCIETQSTTGIGTITFTNITKENCIIDAKAFTFKISYFLNFTEASTEFIS